MSHEPRSPTGQVPAIPHRTVIAPFHVELGTLIVLGVTWPLAALAGVIPGGLRVTDDRTGILAMSTTVGGWGFAPFTNFYAGIDLVCTEAPDEVPAIFRAFSVYPSAAAIVFNRTWNRRIVQGHVDVSVDSGRFRCDVRTDDDVIAEIRVRADPAPTTLQVAGNHKHVFERGDGDLVAISMSYAGAIRSAVVETFRIGGRAPPLLHAIQPTGVRWAVVAERLPLGIGEPRAFNPAPVLPRQLPNEIMQLLSRLGHAAVLISRQGKVMFANASARSLLPDASQGGRLQDWGWHHQSALDMALGGAGLADLGPAVAMSRSKGGMPLLARAIPAPQDLAGEAAVLVTFTAPGLPRAALTQMLLCLGLTPAESRIAALVGAGRSPRAAARVLGVTENTVRSTLKLIYGKLGIGRQAELAALVARLG